ncbi:hypothetical protein ACVIHI_002959 [Bradyrhizobium sp. USDA 4524]|uniref:hypothetical protein n=1 Tax=Bradyrhizobium TaxID=374 RepID=UPI001CE340C3|nr:MULTISPECIES: hypothetical protein [Bradyrhizobium]MCP1844122.1 hypothetical protein [Bradyrhizobium sp. USDA 4538]MCP1904688.1 hypothetical protein [Bradyrhizobium sp. USDA 4537]MCP1989656.1 hypothetical protein [Bradyrhizobium sp. USDA 4539]
MTDIRLPKHVIDRLEGRWRSRFGQARRRSSELFDHRLEQLRAHRNNIHRYRRLLQTQLSDLEREFIERRLSEETTAMQGLAADIPSLPSSFDRAACEEITP